MLQSLTNADLAKKRLSCASQPVFAMNLFTLPVSLLRPLWHKAMGRRAPRKAYAMLPYRHNGLLRIAFAAVIAAFPLVTGGAALASDCNEDIAALTKKRQNIIDQLNHLAQGGKKQLDPIASCPKLRALVAAERELVAYLKKNKDWCAVPDEALQNISLSSEKTGKIANQACTVAAQIKKAQEQQASGALNGPQQKLPAGPL
jgi:hypothetical protein